MNNNRTISRKVLIETYGCQMNVNDSEVVLSILSTIGFTRTDDAAQASLVLINTCAIRDNAEQRILGRLDIYRQAKKRNPQLIVGILGCMAERLKEKLLSHPAVDLVAGPDAYRDLPRLIETLTDSGQKQINTLLSHEETYGDISPVRMDPDGVSVYISIMRGCNNVCSYCVVPYTRGAERSRSVESILREAREAVEAGCREIILLGQNVDSYSCAQTSFAQLLAMVAEISPEIRVRFSTSHPKDMKDEVLLTMAKYPNICKHIHLPVQSGSNSVLERMNRRHTREWYLERVARIREIMPDCSITTDAIVGFCGESEADFEDTLRLFREVAFDSAFMFQYSERPGTRAARHFADDIPPEVKTARLEKLIALQSELSLESNRRDVGKCFEVLVEGPSKKSESDLMGRTSQNKACVFAAGGHRKGEYVTVRVDDCTPATLLCTVL